MPIPQFREDGWLPEGHHHATLDEVRARFGGTPNSKRAEVVGLLTAWVEAVRAKGLAGTLLLDGGFVTSHAAPGDFDALFLYEDAAEEILAADPDAKALIDAEMCAKRGFDLFAYPASAEPFESKLILRPNELWDVDTRTGVRKGVVEVAL